MDRTMLAVITAVIFAGAPVLAAPLAIPTEFDLNLLNMDGSNIDTNLLLAVEYTDGEGVLHSINSVGDSKVITWGVYEGKSNVYCLISAKDGTDVTITIEGYEPVVVKAVEAGYVSRDYALNAASSPQTALNAASAPQTTIPTTTTTVPSNTRTVPEFPIHFGPGIVLGMLPIVLPISIYLLMRRYLLGSMKI